MDNNHPEGSRSRTARLKNAAETAVQKARAEGGDPCEIMKELSGEDRQVCWGYLSSRPDVSEVQALAKAAAKTKPAVAIEEDGPMVRVRRQWNDWRLAIYRLKDISGLHRSDVSGGIQAAAPHAFVYGYVMCDAMLEGELAHSCQHGPRPHQIKICITKKHNEAVFDAVLEAMAPQTAMRSM